MSPPLDDHVFARIDERVNSVIDDVGDLKRELYGNGNRGLKAAMIELRQAFRIGTWVAGIIAGALILDLSSRVFSFVNDEDKSAAPTSMPLWMRDATNARNDPRADEMRALRRRVESMAGREDD